MIDDRVKLEVTEGERRRRRGRRKKNVDLKKRQHRKRGKKSNTMLFRLPSLLLLLLLLAAQQAVCSFNSSRSHHRGRVLALLPHPSQRFSRFSHLLSSIEARGYEVVARGADDPGLRLREWDSWLWDKVVVIPEEKGEDEVRGGGEREKGEREEKRDEGIDVAIVFSAIECLRRERARGKNAGG